MSGGSVFLLQSEKASNSFHERRHTVQFERRKRMPRRKMVKSKKDVFFDKMDVLGLALTFDEVILKTGYAEVMPDDVSIESRFSRNIPLKNPLVSAAMDRVTEAPMAIQMAELGGLGIVHGALPPKEQAA